jgi:hypothetical protein
MFIQGNNYEVIQKKKKKKKKKNYYLLLPLRSNRRVLYNRSSLGIPRCLPSFSAFLNGLGLRGWWMIVKLGYPCSVWHFFSPQGEQTTNSLVGTKDVSMFTELRSTLCVGSLHHVLNV